MGQIGGPQNLEGHRWEKKWPTLVGWATILWPPTWWLVGLSQEEECTWHFCEIDVDSMRASLLNLFLESITGFQLLTQHETTCSWNCWHCCCQVVARTKVNPKDIGDIQIGCSFSQVVELGWQLFFLLSLHVTSDTSHVSFFQEPKNKTGNLHYCTNRLREYFVCLTPGPHPLEFSARRECGRWTWLSNHILIL